MRLTSFPIYAILPGDDGKQFGDAGTYDGVAGVQFGDVGEQLGDVGEYVGDVGEYNGDVGEYDGDVGEYEGEVGVYCCGDNGEYELCWWKDGLIDGCELAEQLIEVGEYVGLTGE